MGIIKPLGVSYKHLSLTKVLKTYKTDTGSLILSLNTYKTDTGSLILSLQPYNTDTGSESQKNSKITSFQDNSVISLRCLVSQSPVGSRASQTANLSCFNVSCFNESYFNFSCFNVSCFNVSCFNVSCFNRHRRTDIGLRACIQAQTCHAQWGPRHHCGVRPRLLRTRDGFRL